MSEIYVRNRKIMSCISNHIIPRLPSSNARGNAGPSRAEPSSKKWIFPERKKWAVSGYIRL